MRTKTVQKTTRLAIANNRIGCGVDVVEMPRFREAIRRGGQAFISRIFTEREIAYASARSRTKILHLAGRFAVKEAVIKAIAQIDPKKILRMRQIEIQNDKLGRPRVVLHESQKKLDKRTTKSAATSRRNRIDIHISMSHVDSVAVANAIAIRTK